MYDIRQFRPTLYLLVLLGFLGYGIAAEAPGMWFLATVATGLHAWLVSKDKFRPLPRLAANLITLLFAVFLVMRVRNIHGPPILAIGEFLIFLQLVKLYEQRGNRDLAQLLVLSLLLMVAAAISTGSLLFGALFVAYLFLSLYCCLLFHLKTESDHARAVMGLDEKKLNPMTLKQDQRFLARSMRRLTVFVSTVAILMAVMVFLLFPRGTGAGIIGNLAFKPSQAMTGFSDQVSFQDVARITQNETIVAYVEVQKNDKPWGANGEVIYLRGSTPDQYDRERHVWVRSNSNANDVISVTTRNQAYTLNERPAGEDRYKQTIRLLPTGSPVIFAMPGAVSIQPGREQLRLMFGRYDEVLQLQDPLQGELPYTVVSTGQIGPSRAEPRVVTHEVPDRIKEYALQDDVAGKDEKGNLAAQRLANPKITELDERLARNIEHHLQNSFQYTLDLTDARMVHDEDPLVQFLYDVKKGHCEYFAGAMTLLCQSLGMEARVVVGFKCDEFNGMGGYYLVRQSHAHAWVEVLTPNGWQMFDPTASRQAGGTRNEGVWRKLMNFVDYLEYAWGNNVVNYDADSRTSIIQSVDAGLTNTAVHTNSWLEDLKQKFDLQNFWLVSSGMLSALMAAMVCTIVAALLFFLYERIRLRRLARRIGLDQLPSSDQKVLARQLAFYDELLRTLDRRKIDRPKHLTPMEYSRSIGFLPGDMYASVQRLTRIFYRVRYGGYRLTAPQQRRLLRVVERMESAVGAVKV